MYFKGSPESKEQKYLESFCEHYGIDIEKKFAQLSNNEIHQLLYANDQIRYKLAYKEGKRRKQIHLKNAVTFNTKMELLPCDMYIYQQLGKFGGDF